MSYKDTAKETVIYNIKGLKDITFKTNRTHGEPEVSIFIFHNPNDAKQFAGKYRATQSQDNPNIVIAGKDKTSYIFNDLRIGMFGRTNKNMYDQLLYEWYQLSPNSPYAKPTTSQRQSQQSQQSQTKTLQPCVTLYGSNTICFYESNQPYYEFTNFYHAPFTVNNVRYPTSEHYFQAQKFPNRQDIIKEMLSNDSPRHALDTARKYKQHIRKDWTADNYSLTAMRNALQAKFNDPNNFKLKQMLIATGNKHLVEHTINDNFWGDNGDGSGKNWLGELLMELRGQLVPPQQRPLQQPVQPLPPVPQYIPRYTPQPLQPQLKESIDKLPLYEALNRIIQQKKQVDDIINGEYGINQILYHAR